MAVTSSLFPTGFLFSFHKVIEIRLWDIPGDFSTIWLVLTTSAIQIYIDIIYINIYIIKLLLCVLRVRLIKMFTL